MGDDGPHVRARGTQAAVQFGAEHLHGVLRLGVGPLGRVRTLGLRSSGSNAASFVRMLPTGTTRLPGVAASAGKASAVSAKWPRWLVAKVSSCPCGLVPRVRPALLTPALWMSPSNRGSLPSASPARATEVRSARSTASSDSAAGGTCSRIAAMAARVRSGARPRITTSAPAAARYSAMK